MCAEKLCIKLKEVRNVYEHRESNNSNYFKRYCVEWNGKKECRNVGKVYFIVQFCSDAFFFGVREFE